MLDSSSHFLVGFVVLFLRFPSSSLVLLLLISSFSFLLFSILLKVSVVIHSLCWFCLRPRISLDVSVHACFRSFHTSSILCCCFSSARSARTCYLLFSAIWKPLREGGSWRSLILHRGATLGFLVYFLSFSLSVATTRLWSDATSAPLYTLTPCLRTCGRCGFQCCGLEKPRLL